MRRALVFTAAGYVIGVVLLALYGGRVCPLMAGFGTFGLARILAVGFAAALALCAIEMRVRPTLDPARRWNFQWLVWIVPSIAVLVAEVAVAGVPVVTALESAAKMLVGALAIGFFVTCLVTLDLEYEWLVQHAKDGRDASGGRFLSIASRILGFTRRAFVLSGATSFLVAARMYPNLGEAILTDGVPLTILAGVVLLLIALAVITSQYRRTFELLYRLEGEALMAVRNGRYDVRVPLVSHDEFRKIAEGTNEMIAGLREREEMRERFGKHFSPEVMEAILRSDRLGGEQKNVTVFFTDLRNYTALSEKLSADQVVAVLNEYFTIVVDAVYRNRGVLDKFIGDAAMAYFGFTDDEGSCVAALRTALEIRDRMKPLNDKLEARGLPRLDNGIGIHHGPVIAGTIGAASRREFTIIGDTVNVASRLESLTKTIGTPIAVSSEVFALVGDLQQHLELLGEHEVKGKSGKMKVYGLDRSTAALDAVGGSKA